MPRKKSLKSTIRELAIQFADGLAQALEDRISSEPSVTPAPAQTTPAGRVVKAKPATKTQAKSSDLATKILDAIRATGRNGASTADVVAATGLDAAAIGYRLTVLRKKRKLRKTGKTSGTRYFAA
jgi:hypothetical protein